MLNYKKINEILKNGILFAGTKLYIRIRRRKCKKNNNLTALKGKAGR